jgi:hypothetical protein
MKKLKLIVSHRPKFWYRGIIFFFNIFGYAKVRTRLYQNCRVQQKITTENWIVKEQHHAFAKLDDIMNYNIWINEKVIINFEPQAKVLVSWYYFLFQYIRICECAYKHIPKLQSAGKAPPRIESSKNSIMHLQNWMLSN